MNGRTAKLLRKYALNSDEPLATVKREWYSTPHNKRGAVRAAMRSGLWAGTLRRWQLSVNLVQKQAAEKLEVPFETYRDWCDGDCEPSKLARAEIERRMERISDEIH